MRSSIPWASTPIGDRTTRTPPGPAPRTVRGGRAPTSRPARDTSPEWMLDAPSEGVEAVLQEADAHLGRRPLWYRLRQHQVLRPLHREAGAASWEDLPEDIKQHLRRVWASPRLRMHRLVAGVAAQYESEVVYHQIREDLEEQGVIFIDTDTALKEHPEFFEEYFGTVIPLGDNKFAALNTAVWSGGSLRVRAQGRPRRDPAAGLLPHQHREHGPVRADADHRRRGLLRPLRRGLHRPDLQLRLAALAPWWRSS